MSGNQRVRGKKPRHKPLNCPQGGGGTSDSTELGVRRWVGWCRLRKEEGEMKVEDRGAMWVKSLTTSLVWVDCVSDRHFHWHTSWKRLRHSLHSELSVIQWFSGGSDQSGQMCDNQTTTTTSPEASAAHTAVFVCITALAEWRCSG